LISTFTTNDHGAPSQLTSADRFRGRHRRPGNRAAIRCGARQAFCYRRSGGRIGPPLHPSRSPGFNQRFNYPGFFLGAGRADHCRHAIESCGGRFFFLPAANRQEVECVRMRRAGEHFCRPLARDHTDPARCEKYSVHGCLWCFFLSVERQNGARTPTQSRFAFQGCGEARRCVTAQINWEPDESPPPSLMRGSREKSRR